VKLDDRPELFFGLRQVDEKGLIAKARQRSAVVHDGAGVQDARGRRPIGTLWVEDDDRVSQGLNSE
jgi:hypothetical protein